MAEDLPELVCAGPAEWRAWLAAHGGQPTGVWLVLAKKGHPGLTYGEALDEALCEGWIDGQKRGRDPATFAQRFTPRRPRSPWSARNVGLVEALTAAGRMCPAGLAQVEAARADGRWEAAYAGSATAEPPADLLAALAGSPAAQARWDRLTRTNRYAVIWRVVTARTPATRARRIADLTARLARGETPHPQRS